MVILRDYHRGVSMLVVSALLLSTSGVAVRIISVEDGWLILFVRSLAFSLTVFTYISLRKDVRVWYDITHLGWNDCFLVVFLGSGFIAYIFALLHTTVANALFVMSAGPLILALLGWLILREHVTPTTWLAIVGATIGLIIMIGGGFAAGHHLGNLIALWVPVSYAMTVILVRRSARVHMLPALFLSGIFAMTISGLSVVNFTLTLHDLVACLYLGIVQVGLGFILMLLGARFVPSAQVGLISLIEPLCAPILVWLVIGEVPMVVTLIGGAIVFLAILWNGLHNISKTKN